MTLPAEIKTDLATHLSVPQLQARAVGGGCVSPAAHLVLGDGREFFVKWAKDAESGRSFSEEAYSLEQLAVTRTVRVPRVQGRGSRWLLLEWLPGGKATISGWEAFANDLARLHRARGERFGWARENFIGALPQANEWSQSWADFFRTQRLEPQLFRAKQAGFFEGSDVLSFARLFNVLPELLRCGEVEGPSLLHGDLWTGNAHALANGSIAAIDPASYFGHREVDLAMADLFGGFPAEFFRAYDDAWALEKEGLLQRRAVYQLYYLLVHVNMFGGSYVSSCRRALQTALGSR